MFVYVNDNPDYVDKIIYNYLFAILEDKRVPQKIRDEYLDKLRKDLVINGKKNRRKAV